MEDKNLKHTFINIKEGKTLVLNGVINILRFDEKGVTLMSEVGKIEVEGDDLKIDSLTKNDGEIVVTGKIEGVFYYKDRKQEGFFKKFLG